MLRRKFSASHFWGDVIDNNCTMFVYIGELCRYLVNQDPTPKDRVHKLRLAFGNGLRPEVWEEFQARFNVPRIMEFYGSTEGNVSMFNFDGQPGAIGRVPPYLQRNFAVRLVKFNMKSEMPVRDNGICVLCEIGEPGEAVGLIKDDARHNYTGYADKAASTAKFSAMCLRKAIPGFAPAISCARTKTAISISSIASATPSAGKEKTSPRLKSPK